MIDRLSDLWSIQCEQQKQLGLDPKHFGLLDRRKMHQDLVAHMVEEAVALGRLSPSYKRHLLKMTPVDRSNVAEKCVDLMKLLIAFAQMYGLNSSDICEEFTRKTLVVEHRSKSDSVELERNTKLFATDMDGVLCDIDPWYREIERLRGNAPANDRTLELVESFKDQFYKEGGFAKLQPVPGASSSMKRIKAAGYKIAILTARPQWQYKRLHADTVQWLEKNEIPCDILLFNKDKCEALYDHIRPAWPVAFVEDHHRNASALIAIGVRVLLFNRPININCDVTGAERVSGWDEILNKIGVSP